MASSSSGNGHMTGTVRNGNSTASNEDSLSHLSLTDGSGPERIRNILQLPVEVLRNIIAQIDEEADHMVNMDRRGYLSQESFRHPEHPTPEQLKGVGNFRLTCRRFGELGAKHQFIRVTVRFSEQGFERLRGIASVAYLAENVRKFSYMIPCGFYHEKGQRGAPLPPDFSGHPEVNLEPYMLKQQSHRNIMENSLDQIAITEAFRAFKNLQHVQLFRTQDELDNRFEALREQYEAIEDWIRFDWVSACVYGTRSIAEALLISGSPCTRFSSPHLNSNSALILARHPPGLHNGMSSMLINLASRLTCLELHFDQDYQFSRRDRLHELPFEPIFSHAKNLEALHVGFPQFPKPIAVGLEEVFHSIKWDKLVAFGIQGWCLSSEEIIEMARRHKHKLRGLRLRNVYLKSGSRWVDVLHYLRNDMKHLEWVSLRGIGYDLGDGQYLRADVTNHPDHDSDDEDPQEEVVDDIQPATALNHDDNDDSDINSESFNSDDELDAVSDAGTDLEVGFPSHLQHGRTTVRCNCRIGRSITLEQAEVELNDKEEETIKPETRKRWEKWVVKSCPEHAHY